MAIVECSIIIPCGRPQRLPFLFEAIGEQTLAGQRIELIVVSATKPAVILSSHLNVVWVEAGQLFPPGHMRNLGVANARGRVLLFLDDDIIPPADWVETMQQCLMEQTSAGAVGCRVASPNNNFWCRCADFVLFSSAQQVRSGYRPLMSAALAVRMEAFRAVNGFDETLRASEDWDFCLRLKDAGWLCYFDAAVTVQHEHGRGSLPAIVKQAFRSGWGTGLAVQQKHKNKLGFSAQVLTTLAHSWVYPVVSVPYAVAVTVLHAWEMRGVDWRWPLFAPFLALGRLAYQLGVWSRIRHEAKIPKT